MHICTHETPPPPTKTHQSVVSDILLDLGQRSKGYGGGGGGGLAWLLLSDTLKKEGGNTETYFYWRGASLVRSVEE